MIEVHDLSRRFGKRLVIDRLSFGVERGEIVGFLGPNGAGKTTTLRMLSGYLPCSRGRILIGGWDMARQAMEVRRRIGYLPETTPLYVDMRVDEYLRFRARLKGVTRARIGERLEAVKKRCGLEQEGRRIIGQLSKGFRQRVGLADALIHDPDLLILDEPTLGLDPNQVRELRALIKELAQTHTILLSSHQLQEVEMLCHRVLILHAGRIVAADTPAALRAQRGGLVVVELCPAPEDGVRALAALPGVRSVASNPLEDGGIRCALTCEARRDVRPEVFALAAAKAWRLRELTRKESSLEEVFAGLTCTEEADALPEDKAS